MRMNARARETKAEKLALVFSQRKAMRLKRMSFPKVCSIRALVRSRAFGKKPGLFLALAL